MFKPLFEIELEEGNRIMTELTAYAHKVVNGTNMSTPPTTAVFIIAMPIKYHEDSDLTSIENSDVIVVTNVPAGTTDISRILVSALMPMANEDTEGFEISERQTIIPNFEN
jgi:hypothetical protein